MRHEVRMNTVNKDRALRERHGNPSVLSWARLNSGHSAGMALLLVLVLVSGMAVVHSTFKNRYAMHELQKLRSEHNALDVEWGQLLIEQSTFALEDRIERKATEELDMKLPDWSGVVLVKYE